MSDHHHTDKHSKKEKTLAHNKRDQMIFSNAEEHQREVDAGYWGAPVIEASAPAAPTRSDTTSVAHTSKLSMVRNRLTGRKQVAAERWNRFAATSGSGGRGR